MHRILVLANNLQQASYRVRVEALLPLMRERGFDLDVRLRPRNWIPRRRLLASAGGYHAVLLQRKLLDPWDARLLRRSARKIFYDIDDAVMYHNRPVSWLSRWRTSRRFVATTRVIEVFEGRQHRQTADEFGNQAELQQIVRLHLAENLAGAAVLLGVE